MNGTYINKFYLFKVVATFTVEASVRPGDETSPEELGEQIVKNFSTEMGFLGVVDSYCQPLLCALICDLGIFV